MLKDHVVLVVDQSNAVREHLVSILKNELHCEHVFEAGNADEAFEILHSGQKIDWIFSDWEMPGLPGREFLAKVKETPSAQAPVIMLTARGDNENFMSVAQAGVTDCLLKPLNVALLIKKIKRITSGDERRRKERYKTLAGTNVEMMLNTGKIPGSLVDMSVSGCLVIFSVSNVESFGIYDIADMTISLNGAPAHVKAKLIRLENYKEDPEIHKLMYAAFEFVDVTEDTEEYLMKHSKYFIPAVNLAN